MTDVTTDVANASTVDLGEWLEQRWDDHGRRDWGMIDDPDAAQVIEELQSRGTRLAWEMLEDVGITRDEIEQAD